jgi:hypothetical protein
MSLSDRVAYLYPPPAQGSFFIAFYDSQGYTGPNINQEDKIWRLSIKATEKNVMPKTHSL